MNLYFAPLEGLTDAIYRRVHYACFSGVTKYFMPFVSPSSSFSFTVREEADFSPTQNANVPVVPQILAKNPEYFLGMARIFRDLGYQEVNLNLGCPSGTVTGKGKGAGMLRDVDNLRRFLDAIYIAPPLPVSIKSRIGFQSMDEWPALLDVFAQYPIHEWIIHPRTRQEQYTGIPHQEILESALNRVHVPIIYNGDLFSASACASLAGRYPAIQGLMMGRGLAANPALAQQMQGGSPLTRDSLIHFHEKLYREYLKSWPETAVVGRMHLIMRYLGCCFDCPEKFHRAIRKATSVPDYQQAVERLFSECDLRMDPGFSTNEVYSYPSA